MPLPTYSDFAASIAKFFTASDKAHDIVNGPASGDGSTITVESGAVKTHARQQAEMEAALAALTVDNASVNDALAADPSASRAAMEAARGVADAVGRYVGMLGGPPVTGTYQHGDWIQTHAGEMWTCINPGTPGVWQTNGQDLPDDQLAFQPCAMEGARNYPGPYSTNAGMVNERVYLVTYPLHQRVAISKLSVHITTIGQAGSKIKGAIYEDSFGSPKKLLAYGEVAADGTTGGKSIVLNTHVDGGRWIWLALVATDAPVTPPQVAMMNNSPYWPMEASTTPNGIYNGFALFMNGISTFPERFGNGYGPVFSQASNISPKLGMKFSSTFGFQQRALDRHVALAATEEYEQNCLQEPNVHYDERRPLGERYVMIYSKGWADIGLAWATAPHPAGPWTKKGVFWEEAQGRGSYYREGNQIWVYTAGMPLACKTGATIETLGAAFSVLSAIPNQTGQYQNNCVLKRGTNDYILFVEGTNSATTPANLWLVGYATATSPSGPFTMQQFPIAGLRNTPTGMVGGPNCSFDGTTYRLYFHGAEVGIGPTDIYYKESTDLVNWTGSLNPIVERKNRWEVDQVADPHLFVDPVGGLKYLYWDALDNFVPRSCIMMSNPNVMNALPGTP